VVLFGERDLFRHEVLVAVDRGPRRRGVPAADELLVDALVAAPAVARGEALGDDEAVVVPRLLAVGRSVSVHGRTGAHSFAEIKVGFGTLYRVNVIVGMGAGVPSDHTCRTVIAMLGEAGRLVRAEELDPEPVLETPQPALV